MARNKTIAFILFATGIGCMRAWALTFLQTCGVSFPLSALSAGTLYVAAPTLLISIAFISYLARKRNVNLLEARILILASACLAAGSGFIAIGPSILSFRLLGLFIACVGFAILLLQCGALSFEYSAKKLIMSLSLGFVFAATICLVFLFTDKMTDGLIFSSLGPLSCISLGMSNKFFYIDSNNTPTSGERKFKLSFNEISTESKIRAAKESKHLLAKLFITTLLMELVARSSLMISAEFAVRQLSYTSFSFEIARFAGTIITLLAFSLILKISRTPLQLSYKLVPLLLIASCLILLPAQLNLTFVTYAIAFSAGAFFEITIWILYIKSHSRIEACPITIWAVGRIAFWSSTFIGLSFWAWQSSAFENGITSNYAALFTLVVIMSLVVVLVYCLILPESTLHSLGIMREPDSTQGSEQEEFEKAIKTMSESAGLTERESEILLYLARGRSTAYISEKLFISSGTVSSHRDRIYRKLGVHSKQELLDLLERIQSNS